MTENEDLIIEILRSLQEDVPALRLDVAVLKEKTHRIDVVLDKLDFKNNENPK